MPSTYEPIATTTLGSAASTITFSSIVGTYTDLRLVFNLITPGYDSTLTVNGDSGTNYSYTLIRGNGTSAVSGRGTSTAGVILDYNASSPALFTVDFFSYAGSTNKTFLTTSSEDANGSGTVDRKVGLWRNTAAITSVTLSSTNMSIGTTATLYGIKNA